MIRAVLTDPGFTYDVHSLIKAFCPADDVSVGNAEGADAAADIFIGAGARAVEIRTAIRSRKEEVPENISRQDYKSLLKRALYRVLAEETGRTLPWGTLSGIRPVKIPRKLLSEGVPEERIRRVFAETYLADAGRAEMALGIAKREIAVTEGEEALMSGARCDGLAALRRGYSLYVSVPFCPSICLYCSFPSGTIGAYAEHVDAYLDALDAELAGIGSMMRGKKLYSIYIGGGTPTSLSARQLTRLLAAVDERFDARHVLEYTVEAGRPDTIDPEKLAILRSFGVGRISINPQTMDDRTLSLIGRAHTSAQIKEAFAMAAEAGFTDINADLIAGLPGEGTDELLRSAAELIALNPASVTVHSLALKRSSRLYELVRAAAEKEKMGIEAEGETGIAREAVRGAAGMDPACMEAVAGRLEGAGYFPYYLYRQKNIAGNLENIGFAKKGCTGLYNILMMEELQTVAAAGAGSVSKYVWPDGERIERAANVSDIRNYIERTEEMLARKHKVYEEMREEQ